MPRKILIVDDIAANRMMLHALLSHDYEVMEASGGAEALDILTREGDSVSAVLLDIVMPVMDGYEVLQRMRENADWMRIPVIMITGSEDDEARVRSLSEGANDFVMKPYKPDVIKHCLETNIALHESIAFVKSMQRDKLTGLLNREPFFQRVQEMVAAHEAGYYIMACYDVDNFKVINDQYGTQMGDAVLRHIGGVFKEGFHSVGGLCCRMFGDLFAVLYPASFRSSPQIEEIRCRSTAVAGLIVPVIFSIGRYVVDDLTLEATTMFDRANIAMDSVKSRYDCKIAQYDESMRARLLNEQQIVSEMGAALAERQFEVWYQPQYNYATKAMVGAEALVRWRHPKKGLVMPGSFIPIFEQNGFIYRLDRFVWEETCRNLRKWLDEGASPLPVSVNVSRYDILTPDLVDVLTGLTEEYRLPVSLLRLEVTESAFASSTQQVLEVVTALIQRGFTVEIDDFGSGYSSLNTLKDVPAQIIKLDMRFLDSSNSERGGNIVESVVRMAKWLGMSVIAEGVETLAQANYLRSIGCSYMQGYLFDKPMPCDAYETHCAGMGKEEHLLALETVENLDNNSFWDPNSIDTLIFNSFVGGACIYEYHNGKIELLRATEKYTQIFGSADMTVENAIKLDWSQHLDEESRVQVANDLNRSIETKEEVAGEYVFVDLPGCPHRTYLRATLRVIATAGDRYLVYCTNENITAQREAETRERATAEQLQSIMDSVDVGIATTVFDNSDLRILVTNNRFYEMRGYTRAQYAAEMADPHAVVAKNERAEIRERIRQVAQSGDSAVFEYEIVRRDGAHRYIRSAITNGSFAGISAPVQLSIFRDITEETEAALREQRANEQVQVILRDIDSGLTAVTLQTGRLEQLFSNEQFYRMRGYTREQYRAEVKDYVGCVHPEDRARVRKEIIAAFSSAEPIRDEYRIVLRDKTVRWVRVNLSVTHFTGDARPVVLSVFSDATAEKNAELATEYAFSQMQSMMDDMPGGYARLILRPDGSLKLDYVNEGYCRLTGMDRSEVVRAFDERSLSGMHPDDVARVQQAVRSMAEDRVPRRLRVRVLLSGGDYAPVNIFCRITEDAQKAVYVNIYYTDASEQVKDEEWQKALLDNLPGGAGIYELMDGEMRLVYQNKSYWELVGLNVETYLDPAPMSAIHPDDVAVIERELAMAIQQQRDVSCDIMLRHLTLGYRPVHLAGRIVPQDNGRIWIYATFTPIAGEGQSYQKMLPLLLSALMESTSELSFAKDTDFRYLCVSDAFAKLVGAENAAALVGKTDYDLFDTALADKFRRDDVRLVESETPIVDMVESIPSADGVPRYSSTSKYLLRDGLGRIVGIYGAGRDVTRSMTEQTRLGFVANSIPGGLASYACTAGAFSMEHIRLVYYNDGFCRLFGFPREEFEHRAAAEPLGAVLNEDEPALAAQWTALMEHGAPVNCLYRVHVSNVGCRWIRLKAVAADRSGDTVIVNAILQDETEQSALIEQLRLGR